MFRLFLILCGSLLLMTVSIGASASVRFQILTDNPMTSPVFAGRTTGQDGDIIWR